MDAESAPAPHHDDEANGAPDAESPANPAASAPDATSPDAGDAGPEASIPADVRPRRIDQVALALLAGIVILLLLCVVIILVAWRHAPVNPAIPAAILSVRAITR